MVSLVQTSGSRLEDVRRRVFDSLNLSHHYDVEIERRVNLLVERGYFSQDEGNRILDKLLEVGFKQDELIAGFENRIMDYFEQQQVPSKNDFESLTKRLENLTKRVDTLSVDSIADKTN